MAKKSKFKPKNKSLKHKATKDKINKEEKLDTIVSSDNKENINENGNITQPIKKCNHLKKMVKIGVIKTKLENDKTSMVCEDCEENKAFFKDIYICLTCVKVLCGNNDDNHIENHFKTTKHCIYCHVKSRTCYCFLCEEDILYGENNNSILIDVKKIIDQYESKVKNQEVMDIRKQRYLENAKKTAIYPGLKNLKHTCFFNSVMQCLTYTKPFEKIINDEVKLEEGPLTNAFVSFIKTIHKKLREAEEKQKKGEQLSFEIFTPTELFDQIIAKWDQYKEYNQQDGHELLRHLLDGIRDEQIKVLKEKGEEQKKNIIDELFEGKLINYIVCDTCKLIKHNYEPFYDLSLSITDEFNFKKETNKSNEKIGPDDSNIDEKLDGEKYPLVEDSQNQKDFESILQDITIERNEKDELSIRDCLKKFMDIDTLEGKEACVCDNCTKIRYGDEEKKDNEEKKKVVYRRIKKRSFIDEAPKILVLNLKRFVNINLYGHVRKSEKFVDFQPFLKLGPYLSPIRKDQDTQPFYRLYGVVVHSGFSIQSGHYFAYISRSIGDWFYASDATITPSSWDEVKKSRPYLLFYERVR